MRGAWLGIPRSRPCGCKCSLVYWNDPLLPGLGLQKHTAIPSGEGIGMKRTNGQYLKPREVEALHAGIGAGRSNDELAAQFNIAPFRLAEEFIAQGRKIARVGCAALVRASFLEGIGRYERLYSINPPTMQAQFVERLPMVKCRIDPDASTATSYCWLVWVHGMERQPYQWIPPCRKHLELAGDYKQIVEELA